jgi:methylase of polypeptide subunit release factors
VRQAGKVSELIRSQGSYEKTEIKKDLGGIERIVFARKA